MQINSEQVFLEKYKKNILKQAISIIYQNKDHIINLSKQEILDIVLKPKIIKRCLGISSTFTQCTSNALQDQDYCKRHLKYSVLNKELDPAFEITKIKNKIDESKIKMSKKFINDTFYFIDTKYIYDIEENDNVGEKVGIINKNKFLLTSDPFILHSI
jgi:hypothetical protein